MGRAPKFEFHVSRAARERFRFEEEIFSWNGNVLFANIAATRQFAEKMNRKIDADKFPERAIPPGALNAMALIDELLHVLLQRYREQRDPKVMIDALTWFESRVGAEALDRTLLQFVNEFPPQEVYAQKLSPSLWLQTATGSTPHRAVALEEMMMLWLANLNPAFRRFHLLFDDKALAASSAYREITAALGDYFHTRPRFGPQNQTVLEILRAPALASPDSLDGQLAFLRENWETELGDLIRRILIALDIFKEEEIAIWMRFHPQRDRSHFGNQQMMGDSSAAAIPRYTLKEPEYERFSPDVDWMPRTVMMAKSAFVWLDQLSKQYRRHIHRLDQVPDEELDTLARRGFNALWLIGLWERSRASQRIKQLTGNPEAAASAYSLFDYEIAADLGGEGSYLNLRDRAAARGIRMGSDMVPNHMGIDSRWLIEHPDWFLSLPYPPFPAYRFDGPDLSSDGRVEIKLEDHYYNKTDAAVVFRRRDHWSGESRYIYHGNDGTSYPWNDTAQLNYLHPEVREAVIQKILHVARLSPIIRFDAAMTLAKQHYQRLWFPAPGTGGAIPSRAEHGLTKPEFDAAMPVEFWREVVDRCAVEAPGTLLLAEAFWLLEGYFVRTLGMHRVYNSAFMNMLRDEENANYRGVIKKTIEFDPEILKRYVNFMNNPDERTAVDQFGKGDKYFGVCTMMATLPGLPMFGHGQIEGYTERYGMEYRRAYHDESPDPWLVARHERQISPLLHRRALFADVANFLLYDFYNDSGSVNEDIFAYSNRLHDERALVIFNNRFADARGWIRISTGFAEKQTDGNRWIRQRTLADAFALSSDPALFLAARDMVSGQEHLYSGRELAEKGMRIELGAYHCRVLLDWKHLHDEVHQPWRALYEHLQGRGVASLSDAMRDLQLRPVHEALQSLLNPQVITDFSRAVTIDTADRSQAPLAKRSESQDGKLREGTLASIQSNVCLLLQRSLEFASSGAASALGVPLAEHWQGDLNEAAASFTKTLQAATQVPILEQAFAESWSKSTCGILPTYTSDPSNPSAWAAVIGWIALRVLGQLLGAENPEVSAVKLFDALRLREPLANIFEQLGLHGEDRWRAAARVRALLTNAPSSAAPASTPRSTFGWLRDPDVAWLIGVHDYEGKRYFNREQFECLLWWMVLPALVSVAAQEQGTETIHRIETQIRSKVDAAEKAGYQIAVLFEMGEIAEPKTADSDVSAGDVPLPSR
ncbi:MAG TPA: alpha-amylase family glycosyl hydrolase [Terriglobales bacterium]|nr:alpha-amylase family glycosyl hydrolase [Terriglobales bacterium]